MKIRLSKKFVVIIGGVLVLCGASGSAAVLVGTDKILGPSYKDLNGLECTLLQSQKFNRDHRTWVRKYVTSDVSADGMTRVRTALRVARAVQEKEKADLVQVAMIDPAGPKDRAQMRGRMIAAQVVYIPDLAKAPESANAAHYSAYYLDGAPTASGEYFGMRIDLPLEDVEHLEAKLTDKADCIDPAAVTAEGAHGGKGAEKGAAKGGGHGEKKPSGHGEAKPSGHGEPPAGHGEAAGAEAGAPAADGHGEEVSAKEDGGFLSSITGMIFGSDAEKTAEHGNEGGEHASLPAAGHATDGEAAPAKDEAHAAPKAGGDAAGGHAEATEASEDHGEQVTKPAEGHGVDKGPEHGAAAEHGAASEPAKSEPAKPAVEQSFIDQVKGMIFGDATEDAPAHDEAKADAALDAAGAHEPRAPRTSAEGGKRWSNSSDADEIRSEEHGPDQAAGQEGGHPGNEHKPEHAEAEASGPNAADAAGEAWLEKFRAQSGEAAAPMPTPEAEPKH